MDLQPSDLCTEKQLKQSVSNEPSKNLLVQVNIRNTRKWCETCSTLTIKIPEQHSRGFINFENISHLSTLSR